MRLPLSDLVTRRRGVIRRRSVRRTAFPAAAAAVILAIGLTSAAVTSQTAAATGRPAYLNSHLPVQARVADLLGRMTLPEKIGQMVQIEATQVTDASDNCTSQGGFNMPNPVCEQKIFVDNIMQTYAMQHSRLHIPVIFGVDAVHGFGHPWQAPLFPQSIGIGATWDPAAAMGGGQVTANALRATGWVWDFAPVQDLARDNRWGRTYETWAEEPALAAALGAANVAGLQAPAAGGLQVSATVKHFAGYSQSVNGHDRNGALLPLNYLQSMILPSYAGGIDAGAGAVMVDSGSINGVPATSSHYLLTDILRKQMG